MKRIIGLSVFLLLSLSLCLGQLTPSAGANTYYSPTQHLADINGLPAIRGTWYFVDPTSGNTASDGKSIATAMANFDSAYARCASGAGDGIALLSRDIGTSASTTSYLKKGIVWAKYGITVFGIQSETYFGRARIASQEILTSVKQITEAAHTFTRTTGSFITDGWKIGLTGIDSSAGANNGAMFTVTNVTATAITFSETFSAVSVATVTLKSYCAPLIKITGSNNAFYNLEIVNQGTITADTGGVSIQANRNYMKNVHIIGAGSTLAAALATYQFDLEVDASECTFDDCYFGTNSTLYGAANGHIKLGNSTTGIGQDFFNHCHVISNSATAGHAAIWVTNAATLGGWVQFSDCTFQNWQSGAITALTVAIAGATPNNCGIFLHNCGEIGWAAWGANNDKWVTDNAAGAAGIGGIGLNIQ